MKLPNKGYQKYCNYDLGKRSLIGIGGIIKSHYEIYTIEGLKELLTKLEHDTKKIIIIGGTTNMLLDDEFDNQVSLHINNQSINFRNEHSLVAGAGVKLPYLCRYLTNLGYKGFSKIADIPGELGGAITNNSGSYNQTISDYLLDVTIIDFTGNIIKFSKDQLQFQHHCSRLKIKKEGVIFEATFLLEKGDKEQLTKELNYYHLLRQQTQPQRIKTLGSTFSNPSTHKAYQLINGIEIDYQQFYNVKMNQKHANFLEIYGKTSKKSVLELIAFIIDKVYNKYDIKLELEIEI